MVIRDISKAKAELSALIEVVQGGDEVIITKAGKRWLAWRPIEGRRVRGRQGGMAGEIWIAPDFDDLPDDMAEALGVKAA